MTDIVLHSQTQQQLADFVTRPSHAILLQGSAGIGKLTLAHYLTGQVLAIEPSAVVSHPYVQHISPIDNKAITIESVRALEHFLSLRVPFPEPFNRAVIIEDAHRMSGDAQNALLKTLEEPPEATLIVLSATSAQALLPTISSRLQSIVVKRPSKEQLSSYFAEQGSQEADIGQAYNISGGLPGLMSALLSSSDHPLKPAVETARALLQQTVYERLLQVDSLSKQRQLTIDVLFILQQMAHARLQSTTGQQFQKWSEVLEASYTAHKLMLGSAQPKLVLDSLMLKLN